MSDTQLVNSLIIEPNLTNESITKTETYIARELPLDILQPFANHPFKLYTGEQFDAMVESIRFSGVINPIVVRPTNGEKYEILSGHNRVNASKEAGKETIPARILTGLTEEDALVIVTETNIYQRSFNDMPCSERAIILAAHYDGLKRQGRRTDLTQIIDSIVEKTNDLKTSGTLCQKSDIRKNIGKLYNMSGRSVADLLRVNKLIAPFKERLDNNKMALRTAVELSFISNDMQEMINDVISSNNQYLQEKDAKSLRDSFKKGELDSQSIKDTLLKEKEKPLFEIKLTNTKWSEYICADWSNEKISDFLLEAVVFQNAHKEELNKKLAELPNFYPVKKGKKKTDF